MRDILYHQTQCAVMRSVSCVGLIRKGLNLLRPIVYTSSDEFGASSKWSMYSIHIFFKTSMSLPVAIDYSLNIRAARSMQFVVV